jgi:hypothetical protein
MPLRIEIENDEEAEELLRALSHYYRQPVLPLHRMFSVLNAWADRYAQRNTYMAQHLLVLRTDLKEALYKLFYAEESAEETQDEIYQTKTDSASSEKTSG